ncbi:MAG: histidine kinase [Clostridiaceae bacterium]|nr:histidine kinase [Clostridiaceae bacterium]
MNVNLRKNKLFVLLENILNSVRLRTKLVITYIVIIITIISFLGVSCYKMSSNLILDVTAKNVYELIKKNNEIVDEKLSKALDSSIALIADKSLFNTLSSLDPDSEESIIKSDRIISNILSRYLMNAPGIYSYKLVTSYYTFTPDAGNTSPGFLPFQEFSKTSIYSAAKKAQGKAVWIPTYDFVKEFRQKDLEDIHMEGRYVFSMARMIDCLDFVNGQVLHLSDEVERPFLVIDYLPGFFTDVYNKSNIVGNSMFFVASKDGTVVAQSENSQLVLEEQDTWLDMVREETSGYVNVVLNGEPWILCFDTSNVTGWITMIFVNAKELTAPLLIGIRNRSFYIAITLCLVSMIIAYIISIRVTTPIDRLTKAAKKIGSGDFDVMLHEEYDIEFKQLADTMNYMSSKIKTLIRENYEVKIREKEATIGALTLQLNPHFLYNTINIINWIAIRNKQNDISKMLISLSYMLNYTVRTKQDIVRFSDDLEWLEKYLYIMSIRFEGKFIVEYDINPEVLSAKVPKLFLQPIIENVFTHAFSSMESDGTIKISAKKDGNLAFFSIEDNGKGICKDDIDMILNRPREDNLSIGISNVNRRIKIIYGEEYGIKIEPSVSGGTKVIIVFPFNK